MHVQMTAEDRAKEREGAGSSRRDAERRVTRQQPAIKLRPSIPAGVRATQDVLRGEGPTPLGRVQRSSAAITGEDASRKERRVRPSTTAKSTVRRSVTRFGANVREINTESFDTTGSTDVIQRQVDRVGNARPGKQIVEIPFAQLRGLHPLPNPERPEQRNYREEDTSGLYEDHGETYVDEREEHKDNLNFGHELEGGRPELEREADHVYMLMGLLDDKGFDLQYAPGVLQQGETYLLLGGHHRAAAMFLLHEATMPCYIFTGKPDSLLGEGSHFTPFQDRIKGDQAGISKENLEFCVTQ